VHEPMTEPEALFTSSTGLAKFARTRVEKRATYYRKALHGGWLGAVDLSHHRRSSTPPVGTRDPRTLKNPRRVSNVKKKDIASATGCS